MERKIAELLRLFFQRQLGLQTLCGAQRRQFPLQVNLERNERVDEWNKQPKSSHDGGSIRHLFLRLRVSASHNGTLVRMGGLKGPY